MNFEKSPYHNDIADLVREILSGREAVGTKADSGAAPVSPGPASTDIGSSTAAARSGGAQPDRDVASSAPSGFDAALWRELAKADVLSAALPESIGGTGLGLLEQCAVLTEVGRAVAPAPYLASIVLGASAIAEFGTDDQQRRWAEPAARGELLLTAALQEDTAEDPRSPTTTATRTSVAAAIPTRTPLATSPTPGSNVTSGSNVSSYVPTGGREGKIGSGSTAARTPPTASPAPGPNVSIAQSIPSGTPPDRVNCAIDTSGGAPTGAREAGNEGGQWVVAGVKTGVWAAPWADVMLVPAATADGVAVFVVERSDAGVTVEAQELTDGVTAGRVVLDDVVLDDDRVLGGTAADLGTVASWLGARGTVGLCALQLGVTERALELTADYARNRVQFGRPIGSFQAVSQRLADSWIDVEAIRLTMWQAAWLLSEEQSGSSVREIDAAVASAKFWAADAGHRVAHTAVHVHGGVGIDTSYLLNRYFAAAKHHEFALGGAITQLRRIGARLAKS